MEKKFHFVYLTTNLINGKQYIGDHSTNKLNDSYIGSGRPYFQRAINEYGKENFKREILEFFSSKEEAFNAQENYIIKYNTLSPNGYNISPKGGHNVKGCISEETKQKISKANKGRKLVFSIEHRRKLSENNGSHRSEVREKIRNSSKGRKLTEEHKQKLKGPKSEEHKQHMIGKNKGKIRTPEMIERKRQLHLGKHHTEQTKQNMKHPHKPFSKETLYKMKLAANKTKTCPYCNITFNAISYNRWHGNNCKKINKITK